MLRGPPQLSELLLQDFRFLLIMCNRLAEQVVGRCSIVIPRHCVKVPLQGFQFPAIIKWVTDHWICRTKQRGEEFIRVPYALLGELVFSFSLSDGFDQSVTAFLAIGGERSHVEIERWRFRHAAIEFLIVNL